MHEIGRKEGRVCRYRHDMINAGPVRFHPLQSGMNAGQRPLKARYTIRDNREAEIRET